MCHKANAESAALTANPKGSLAGVRNQDVHGQVSRGLSTAFFAESIGDFKMRQELQRRAEDHAPYPAEREAARP